MAAAAASYDPVAWIYNRHWGQSAEWLLPVVNEIVLGSLSPPRRVLDLCCGTGQLARALQEDLGLGGHAGRSFFLATA